MSAASFLESCRIKARELTRAYASGAPPFRLEQVLGRYGIQEIRPRLLDGDARLRFENGRFVIEVNSLFPSVRQRLSIAHEIGHLILNECAGKEPTFAAHTDPVSERLCNDIAGELLVPEWALTSHVNRESLFSDGGMRITARDVLETAAMFEVSVEVMTKRIFSDLQLAPDTVAIVWRSKRHSKQSDSGQKLRITSAWHSQRIYVPLNKTAAAESLVARAFETGATTHGTESVAFISPRQEFEIEAAPFASFITAKGTAPTRAVLALMVPRKHSALKV
jgi:Zn-dependent peptidase ImmA (M78 family)